MIEFLLWHIYVDMVNQTTVIFRECGFTGWGGEEDTGTSRCRVPTTWTSSQCPLPFAWNKLPSAVSLKLMILVVLHVSLYGCTRTHLSRFIVAQGDAACQRIYFDWPFSRTVIMPRGVGRRETFACHASTLLKYYRETCNRDVSWWNRTLRSRYLQSDGIWIFSCLYYFI